MASDTVITEQLLDLARVKGVIRTALLGKTMAEASDLYLNVVRLSIANSRLTNGDRVSYSVDGQSVSVSMSDAVALVEFLEDMAGYSNPFSLPVRWA